MTDTVACDEPVYPLDTVCDMLRDAIQSCHFEDPEIKPELLSNLRFQKSRFRDSRLPSPMLTASQALDIAKRLLTGFGSPVYRLPDDERHALVACVITRGAAMESGDVIVSTQAIESPLIISLPPAPPEDGWRQFCADCGKAYVAKTLKSKFCSDRCRQRSADKRNGRRRAEWPSETARKAVTG